MLIPEIQACSDTGTVLVRDPASNQDLEPERGVVPFQAFDSFGYRVSDSGAEYASWLIDDQQFANERQLSGGGTKLLDVRYLYDGVLYDAITSVKEEDQAISVPPPFEEPNQNFAILEQEMQKGRRSDENGSSDPVLHRRRAAGSPWSG